MMFLEIGKLVLQGVVALVIVGVILKVAWPLFFGGGDKDPTLTSYEALLEEIRNLDDGQTRQVPVFTEKSATVNYVIVGFPEGVDTISGACDASGLGIGAQVVIDSVDKDSRVCGDGPCLCYYTTTIIDEKYIPGPAIRCDPVKYSLKGGVFDVKKGDVPIGNLFHHIRAWTSSTYTNTTTQISCNYAVVPSFGTVGIVEIFRENKVIYMCWGDNCRQDHTCKGKSASECESIDVCVPEYLDDTGTMKECFHCGPDFDCEDLGGCKGNCVSQCNNNPCGRECGWRDDKCRDFCESLDWNGWQSNSGRCYPTFSSTSSGNEFSVAHECPADFLCPSLGVMNGGGQHEEACNARPCGKDCFYKKKIGTDQGSCISADNPLAFNVDSWEECLNKGHYPVFDTFSTNFKDCEICSTVLTCNNLNNQFSHIKDKDGGQTFKRICEEACGWNCVYDQGTCRNP